MKKLFKKIEDFFISIFRKNIDVYKINIDNIIGLWTGNYNNADMNMLDTIDFSKIKNQYNYPDIEFKNGKAWYEIKNFYVYMHYFITNAIINVGGVIINKFENDENDLSILKEPIYVAGINKNDLVKLIITVLGSHGYVDKCVEPFLYELISYAYNVPFLEVKKIKAGLQVEKNKINLFDNNVKFDELLNEYLKYACDNYFKYTLDLQNISKNNKSDVIDINVDVKNTPEIMTDIIRYLPKWLSTINKNSILNIIAVGDYIEQLNNSIMTIISKNSSNKTIKSVNDFNNCITKLKEDAFIAVDVISAQKLDILYDKQKEDKDFKFKAMLNAFSIESLPFFSKIGNISNNGKNIPVYLINNKRIRNTIITGKMNDLQLSINIEKDIKATNYTLSIKSKLKYAIDKKSFCTYFIEK